MNVDSLSASSMLEIDSLEKDMFDLLELPFNCFQVSKLGGCHISEA